MRFALAIVAVVLCANRVDARQVEPKRVEETGATLCVRVVAPKPAPQPVTEPIDVAVRAVPVDGSLERGRLAAAIARAHAVAAKSGASVDVPRPAGTLVVVASAPGLWSEFSVDADDEGPVELTLHPDRSLAVRVVDARGRPEGRVPVAIADYRTSGSLPDVALARATLFRALAVTRERDGVARFDHVQEWIDPFGAAESVALLAVPHRDHDQVRITSTLLESGSVELQVPPFGSVELRFPGVAGATVRLRERPLPPSPDADLYDYDPVGPGEWRHDEPFELEVVDGVARCDRIGVGCLLEIEARWNGLNSPFHAEFAGPARAGASVAWSLGADGDAARAATASFTGRLVDEGRRPLASRSLRGWLGAACSEFDFERARVDDEFAFATDANGGFTLSLGPRARAPGKRWWLEIFSPSRDDDEAQREVRAWIDLGDRIAAGPHDLGDRLVVGSDAKRRVAALKDDELIAEATLMRDWPRFGFTIANDPGLDLRLNELARRGGATIAAFLEREIARLHEQAAAPAVAKGVIEQADPSVALEWAVLLRRAQRKPAPIALEPVAPECETTSPEAPDLSVRIHDVDVGFNSISVPHLDHACWRVTVFDRAGQEIVEPRDEPWLDFGGVRVWGVSSTPLQNDESYVERVPLGRQFENVRPGEYRVRVDYRIGDVVHLTSGDLVVRVRPVPIRVSRRDYAAMVAWIRAIDVANPVFLIRSAIRPSDEFYGDAESPADHVARCGRTALPALLDELAETTDDPRRRAWILGLLFDLQVAKSITDEQMEAATGAFEWSQLWPTVLPSGDGRGRGVLNPGHHDAEVARARDASPDPRVQRDLAATWTDLRAWFEITIEK